MEHTQQHPEQPAPALLAPGQAREMQFVQAHPLPAVFAQQPALAAFPAAPPAFAVAAPAGLPGGEREARDQLMRQRVTKVAVISASYAFFYVLVDYVLNVYIAKEFLSKVADEHDIGTAQIVLGTLPRQVWAMVLCLLLPACGYFGAKRNNSCLLGSFCCCSCFQACCGIFWLVIMMLLLGLWRAWMTPMENLWERCDPHQCMTFSDTTSQQIDCLAYGMWPENYNPSYPETDVYPTDCLKHPLVLVAGPWLDCHGDDAGDDAGRSSRRLLLRRHYILGGGGHGKPDRLFTPSMPEDPLAQCEVSKKVEGFHDFVKVAPEILPEALALSWLRVFLLLPAYVVACFAFCWGKDLYYRSQQGYAQFGYGQQVMMQPALPGTDPRPASSAMVQPLILNPPPVPAPGGA